MFNKHYTICYGSKSTLYNVPIRVNFAFCGKFSPESGHLTAYFAYLRRFI